MRRLVLPESYCELCHRHSRKRLCPACMECIARLVKIWPDLDVVARGRLHYSRMEQELQQAKAAAAGPQE